MTENSKQFLQSLNRLPEEVALYFNTDIPNQAVKELAVKYKVNEKALFDSIDIYVINGFNFSQLESKMQELIGFKEAFTGYTVDVNKGKDLAKDYLGMVFLPIADFVVSADIKKELEKRGGVVRDYQRYINLFTIAIENANMDVMDELLDLHAKTVDPKLEKEEAIDLFQINLVDILKSGSGEPLMKLNAGLIYLLNNVEGFKDEILKILLGSGEKLTSRSLVFPDRQVEPSVSNWIKDFLREKGSSMFNNVILIDYLTSSTNTKVLSKSERELVGKLLQLYHNLKWYPENMAKLEPEEWEIFPISQTEERLTKIKRPIAPPQPLAEPVKPITPVQSKISQLKSEIEQEAPGSLERLALEEELRRLESSK